MLRDLLLIRGFEDFDPKVVTVTVHGCDEHCVVLCGDYICDATAWQFAKGDSWVVTRGGDARCEYVMSGNPDYDETIERLQGCVGFEEALDNGCLDEDRVKALLAS